MNDNDVVGYRTEDGTVYCADATCLDDTHYINQDSTPILRKNATDEGRFLTCNSCTETLDREGEEAQNAQGMALAGTSVAPFESTGNPGLDYQIQKGQVADPRD